MFRVFVLKLYFKGFNTFFLVFPEDVNIDSYFLLLIKWIFKDKVSLCRPKVIIVDDVNHELICEKSIWCVYLFCFDCWHFPLMGALWFQKILRRGQMSREGKWGLRNRLRKLTLSLWYKSGRELTILKRMVKPHFLPSPQCNSSNPTGWGVREAAAYVN